MQTRFLYRSVIVLPLAIFLCFALAVPANAATVTSNLGNTASALVDGQLTTIFDLLAAQGGQPVPFDQGYGMDPGPINFSETWTHNYVIPGGDTITSASIEIGIVDHDSASAGSQLALFDVDGTGLTAAMDVVFEASGGASSEYNEYSVIIPAGAFPALADGSALISLDLMGPVESPNLFPPPPVVLEPNNGASLIYSTLTINTQTSGGGGLATPEPSTLALLGLGGIGLLFHRRLRRRR